MNLDKEEYINPFNLDDGVRFFEFAGGTNTTLAMALLLRQGDDKGGHTDGNGSPYGDEEIFGHWAGDRITVLGDYVDHDPSQEEVKRSFTDISDEIAPLIKKYPNPRYV